MVGISVILGRRRRRTPPFRCLPRAGLKLAGLPLVCAVLAWLPAPPAHAQGTVPSGAGMRPPTGTVVPADAAAEEDWQLRWQATWVGQRKPSFGARYSGENSLATNTELSRSFTATAMLGKRLWRGAELYVNPEVAAGRPLSELTGFAGFPNGELARTSGSSPKLYLARLFVRQSIGFGGGAQVVESDQNQLGGLVDARRLVITAGMFPLVDVFDDNAYSHDPRTQFMNWSMVTHGSFDFAADARGYSRGVAIEWFDLGWAVRVGRFMMPRESNGLALNRGLARSHGDQIEFEREYALAGQPGKLRLLAWRNRAVTGGFDDALAFAAAGGGPPAVENVRRDQSKSGWGINVEQSLGELGGAFLRFGRNDDRTEAYAYTEIGGSVAGGVLLAGRNWGREHDSAGIALARNTLSAAHQRYLAAGGLGFFIGDGQLNYRPERIVELFYSAGVLPRVWLSVNAQRVFAPAYNADRGPATVVGLRLHTNF